MRINRLVIVFTLVLIFGSTAISIAFANEAWTSYQTQPYPPIYPGNTLHAHVNTYKTGFIFVHVVCSADCNARDITDSYPTIGGIGLCSITNYLYKNGALVNQGTIGPQYLNLGSADLSLTTTYDTTDGSFTAKSYYDMQYYNGDWHPMMNSWV
jgi:hypothetical protein